MVALERNSFGALHHALLVLLDESRLTGYFHLSDASFTLGKANHIS